MAKPPKTRMKQVHKPANANGWSRFFAILLVLILALCVSAASWFAWWLKHPKPMEQAPVNLQLAAGSNARSASQAAAEAGVIDFPMVFEWYVRLSGKAGNLKAGTYQIREPISPAQLLKKLQEGFTEETTITFIEGWSWKQIRQALNTHPGLSHDSASLSDTQLAEKLGMENAHPEGWIFPDTYHFSAGSTDLLVLRRAHELMRKELAKAWEQRQPDVVLSDPYALLKLASVVEKETGAEKDRPMISAVFHNRLKIGMRLQTDPTVIYGLGDRFDGNLRKIDLQTDTPYNTYTRNGLPPTPIAMPGRAALMAAARPADSSALYFVARGDGSSHFSATLQEHNKAVDRYIRGKQ